MKKFKNIDYKKFIFIILGTILIGSFFSIFISFSAYKDYIKPIFNPPGIVFPIVWTILYILMAISYYLGINSNKNANSFKIIYFCQLFVNSLWSLLFFGCDFKLFSFIWIIILIVLVVIMIIKLFKLNKIAAYLEIPYLLWLLFASYLNLSIYILNR